MREKIDIFNIFVPRDLDLRSFDICFCYSCPALCFH